MKKYKVVFTSTGSRGDIGSFCKDAEGWFTYDVACRLVGAKIATPLDWEFDIDTGREKVKVVKVKKVEKTEVEDNARE